MTLVAAALLVGVVPAVRGTEAPDGVVPRLQRGVQRERCGKLVGLVGADTELLAGVQLEFDRIEAHTLNIQPPGTLRTPHP